MNQKDVLRYGGFGLCGIVMAVGIVITAIAVYGTVYHGIYGVSVVHSVHDLGFVGIMVMLTAMMVATGVMAEVERR